MSTVRIQPLTPEAFAPYGEVLDTEGAPDKLINQGLCGRYHDRATLEFTQGGSAGISLFKAELRALPYTLDMMERHPLGSQAFLPMSMDAFLVIVALQFVITFSSVRSRAIKNLIKSQPTLLLFQGQFRQEAMAQERVVEAEVRAAIRENGIADVERVHAVVLETDGTFSVIPDAGGSDSALQGVAGLSPHRA